MLMPLKTMGTIVIASRNRHKISEIRDILGSEWNCLGVDHFGTPPEVEETGTSFEENARIKAAALSQWLPLHANPLPAGPVLVLADDSGLEVDALHGAPGVHSARYAALGTTLKGNSPDAANNAKLLAELRDTPQAQRTARFRCVLAVIAHGRQTDAGCQAPADPGADGPCHLFSGACEGTMLTQARGTAGFGYDPLFQPLGFSLSFAELGEVEKNRISHRSAALARFKAWLTQRRSSG